MTVNRCQTIVNLMQKKELNTALEACKQVMKSHQELDEPVILAVQILIEQKQLPHALELLQIKTAQHPTAMRYAILLDVLRQSNPKVIELVTMADQALQLYPDSPHVLLSVGVAYHITKKLDQAISCYEKRLQLMPNDQATMNNLAGLYKDQGDIEAAIDLWQRLPLTDATRLNLALGWLDRGDIVKAEKSFAEILAQYPEHPVALRSMANILESLGDFTQALSYAQKALPLSLDNEKSWLTLSRIYFKLNYTKESIDLLQQGASKLKYPILLHKELVSYWLKNNDITTAIANIKHWITSNPKEVVYPLLLAQIYYSHNDFSNALSLYQTATNIDLDIGATELIRFFEAREEFMNAEELAKQIILNHPKKIRFYGILSEVLYRQKKFNEALDILDEGLKVEPNRHSLIQQKIGQLLAQEQFEQAIPIAQQLVEYKPILSHINLLLEAYKRAYKLHDAIEFCESLYTKDPNNIVWTLLLSNNLVYDGKFKEAINILECAWQREPDNITLAEKLIKLYTKNKAPESAYNVISHLKNIAGCKPNIYLSLSKVMLDLENSTEAFNIAQEGLYNFPTYFPLYVFCADCLKKQQKIDEEFELLQDIFKKFPPEQTASWAIDRLIRIYESKIKVNPNLDTGLQINLVIREQLTKWAEKFPNSLEPYWKNFAVAEATNNTQNAWETLAIIEKRKPNSPDVLIAKSNIYSKQWQMTEALNCAKQALSLRPDNVKYISSLLNIQLKSGYYEEFEVLMQKLDLHLGDSRYSNYNNFFFNINCHPNLSLEKIYSFYQDWYYKSVARQLPPKLPHTNSKNPHRKLKIGYLSPDLRRHAVSYFSEPLLMYHDSSQFELYAFAHLDFGTSDIYTERYKSYVEHWIETAEMSDNELEKYIREHEIDILVDLAGHTANNKLHIMLRRPSPIQASLIFGAGQTTGLPEVDYLIADNLVLPEYFEPYMTEKPLRLTRPGLPFKPAHDIIESTPLPCLTNGFVTFGVLTRPIRTNHEAFAVWAEILKQVPNSKLRFDHIPYVEGDIKSRFQQAFIELGIDSNRLEFCNSRPHWNGFNAIDILLDTFPVGSGTVATESLWMNRPVITLRSRPSMGLITASQLTSIGIDDLCCANTKEEYIMKAVTLASSIDTLQQLSQSLTQKIQNSSLTDYKGYAQDIGKLYRNIWMKYCEE